LSLVGKVIFAGDDPLNMHLLAALAIAEPGWVKFTGGLDLKILDLSELGRFLPRLGARLVSLLPHSQGLPARIEASGVLPDEISLPASLPAEVSLALALAAPLYQNGLRLRLPDDAGLEATLRPVLEVLRSCSLEASLDGLDLSVPHATPNLPEKPQVGLDPFLSTGLLLLAYVAGGQVRRIGRADLVAPQWQAASDLLQSAGLRLEFDGPALTVAKTDAPGPDGPLYNGRWPAYFPYCAVVAATRAHRTRTAQWLGNDLPEPAVAAEFFHRLGLSLDSETGRVETGTGDAPPTNEDPWVSPDARWTMAYALAAFVRPGLALANPGNLVQVYPGFWSLFNTLGRDPRARTEIPKEEPHEEKRKPRRIRTGRDETSGS